MARFERLNSHYTVKLVADPADAKRIPFGAVAGATLFVVDGGGTIVWHASFDAEGDTFPVYDADGAAAESAVSAGNAFDIPAALFACPFIIPTGVDGEAVIAVSS
jgi:hypothetical protein